MIMFTFAARIAQKIAPDDGFGGPAGTGLEWNALKFFPAVLITHTHTMARANGWFRERIVACLSIFSLAFSRTQRAWSVRWLWLIKGIEERIESKKRLTGSH